MSDRTDEREEARGRLAALATEALARWAGGEPPPPREGAGQAARWLEPYRRLLGTSWPPPEPGAPLLSVFSRVRPEGAPSPPQSYWRAAALAPDRVPEPVADARAGPLEDVWAGFRGEWERLPLGGDARFEAFTHLLHKWAWAVPCTYGEPGVSLYDEFRALSALVHASGCAEVPAETFLLVGGDIPGIQRMIYSITSKGAAKGLRGRSFFIQLLGDAVVRRLLAEIDLPETNAVYAAGGNFMLLAPAGAEATVGRIGREINRALLDAFEGDLALCLACAPLAARDVGTRAFAEGASRAVREQIGLQKGRRFGGVAQADWEALFGPQGRGKTDFCRVCQHEQKEGERGQALEGGGWKCDQCLGFEELAQQIARSRLTMVVGGERPGGGESGWQRLLWDLTGQWVAFSDPGAPVPAGCLAYAINDPGFLGRGAHGFRLLSNTTPRQPSGQVRTFEELADGATGLKRVGVLRMDVDNLGQVLTRWLPDRSLASTTALSLGLDRFFSGWLDAVCREVMAEPGMAGVRGGRGDLLYVIYAGGDDLFVVGAWDLMPLLAARIRQRFAATVGGNPSLTISAGITLEDRKFPLYQAAERAGDALDEAKDIGKRQVDGRAYEKDALCFLGQPLGWEAYPFVRDLAGQLIDLMERGVPRGLLGTLRAIHAHYREDAKRARERGLKEPAIHYGPWMWRKVYYLSRLRPAEGKAEAAAAIENIRDQVLIPENMPYVGLATRWAEYLTREEGGA